MSLTKEISMIIFYIVVFPGLVFSIVVGLFLIGIERQVSDLLKKRRVLSIFKPYDHLLKLLVNNRKALIKECRHPKAVTLIIALLITAAIPIFLPFFGYRWINNSSDVIVILYLFVLPAITFMINAFLSGSSTQTFDLLKKVITILCCELSLAVILVTLAVKAGNVMDGNITFSLARINEYQASQGFAVTNMGLLPAFIAFIMIITVEMGTSSFNLLDIEVLPQNSGQPVQCKVCMIIYNLIQSIKIFILILLFLALFFGGNEVHLSGNYVIDLLINLVLLLVSALFLITFSVIIGKSVGKRIRFENNPSILWTTPMLLAMVSFTLVGLKIV
ncbi:MAG: NADH-quinone oxidoreductase subunit H [Bacillota bacterium]|nr:NADH-quinone oxidoreductase subunit H [Bacillota bacterium]